MRAALTDWGFGSAPHRTARGNHFTLTAAWLAFAGASVALGARSDPLLTLILWGCVAAVATVRSVRRGNPIGAAAGVFSAIGLVGAGMSLTAYGAQHCAAEFIEVDAAGSATGFCYAHETTWIYVGAGIVISAVGAASLRLSLTRHGFKAFIMGFAPVAAAILLVDAGGLGIFAAPLSVPVLVWLAVRSRSLLYRIACGALISLTLAEVGWYFWYLGSQTASVVPTPR